jgi:hypothetical protein
MDRFWNKVNKTESCWIWTGRKDSGYGRLTYKGKKVKANRLVWFLTYGEWPDQSIHVLHKCDNRACVNPDHLFLGTNYDNVMDKVQKIEQDSNSNLMMFFEIKKLFESGEPRKNIAKKFNIHEKYVYHVISGKSWGHIK